MQINQRIVMKKENKKNFLIKIACAAGGFIIILAICILSSRFSWFGVHTAENSNGNDSNISVVPETTSSPEDPAPATALTTASATPAMTDTTTAPVTSAVATTPKTTRATTSTSAVTTPATTKVTTTAATTPKATKVTTPSTTAAPEPAWTEEKRSGTMYINTASCSARKEGLQGSKVISYKHYGEAVNVTAITDTGYYKLDDGTYVHSDYLSSTKPVETTTVTTATPSTTPAQSNTQVSSTGITDQPVNCSAEEAEVFRIVNEIRVSYGLAPYKWDANAYKAAKIRCDESFDVFSHLRPDGTKFYTVYGINSEQEKNSVFINVGENLGSGQPTAQKVIDSWMASTAGHRENILNPDIENMAVAFGTYNDDFKYYWVQEFTTYR